MGIPFGKARELEIIGFSLVENGTDSIKKAHECIEKIDELVKGVDHTLKDAVIFLNHGIEILLKVMLEEKNSFLMFSDIDKYQNAKVKMKKENKKDIFEANPNLQTVSLKEALRRLEYLCDIEIDVNMNHAILNLNTTRNKLMHSNLKLNEEELTKLITELKFCYNAVDIFFNRHIKSYNIYIAEARFEFTKEEEREHNEAWAEAYDLGLLDY
ncbi:hypothetical protein [Lysinibacillus varians]|uniref:HEPN AbiU2-like domain-containing protein n=1 Tax=Lysinibacillus varians TaxID=1145276 RepID=A0ABY2THZ6_9BACI|nr:hypothetical protein [Lysinibacillus varians]AHN24365.1 hypothetical protein T479_16290 [Lysinibacillus varians]TKI66102.1 hypothetical protein FC752_05925 [Lysinibacillus varians]